MMRGTLCFGGRLSIRSRRRRGGRARWCGHGGCGSTVGESRWSPPLCRPPSTCYLILRKRTHPPLGGRTTALPCVTALAATGCCRCARVKRARGEQPAGLRRQPLGPGHDCQDRVVVSYDTLDERALPCLPRFSAGEQVNMMLMMLTCSPAENRGRQGRARSSSVLTQAPARPAPPRLAGGRERAATPIGGAAAGAAPHALL